MSVHTSPSWGRWRSHVPLVLVVLAGVAALLAVTVGQDTGTLGAWWPAAGLGTLAVLLARGRRPAVLVALTVSFALGNVVAGRDPLVSGLLALADSLEVVVVVTLLGRLTQERLRRIGDVGGLVIAAAAGAGVAAVTVAATYAAFLDASFGATASMVFAAHGAAVLVLVPLGMVEWRRPVPHLAATTVAAVVIGTAIVLGFGPQLDGLGGVAATALPLPLLVWVAVRHGSALVALHLVWLAVVLTVAALVYPESFTQAAANAQAATAQVSQVLLICATLIALPLSLAVEERERATTRLRESERTFRSAFNRSRLPVLLLRGEGDRLSVVDANQASADLLGRSTQYLEGRGLEELLLAPQLTPALREGWSGPMEVVGDPRTRVDGYCSRLDDLAAADDDGTAWFCLYLVDLTARYELQHRLEDERTYTRAVLDTASSLIVVTDEVGTVIAANPATLHASGFSEEELVGRSLWETLVPARNRQVTREALAHHASLPSTGELRLLTKGGEERTLVYSHAVHRDAGDTAAAPLLVFSANDVTDARESAGMVEHLLRSLTTMAFIGTDLQGRITLFSAGAERLLARTAEQVRGGCVADLFTSVEDGPAPCFADLIATSGPETQPSTRDWLALPDGRAAVRVSMTASPVFNEHGHLQAHFFAARDVTETRRNQEILVNALRREQEVVQRLQELDRVKDDFVSTVSHELRTPMSSIIGSAELLSDGMVGDLEPRQQQMVEVIARNGERLLTLADDLLALATFDRGTWSAKGEVLDLRDVAAESVAAVQSLLAGKVLEHRLVLPPLPVEVMGEASHLERALTNLLGNAIKFTPEGGSVELEVAHDEQHRQAVVRVSDTGLGISETDLARVFDRFYRSAEVQERAIQGSGLGLSIVRSIVETHEGRISLHSAPGEGTTVTVRIPLVRLPQPATPVELSP